MFGIDKGGYASLLLCLGDGMKSYRSLTRRFGAEYFDNSAAGIAADSQSFIQKDASRRNNFYVSDSGIIPQLHQRALPELFFDLKAGSLQSL